MSPLLERLLTVTTLMEKAENHPTDPDSTIITLKSGVPGLPDNPCCIVSLGQIVDRTTLPEK